MKKKNTGKVSAKTVSSCCMGGKFPTFAVILLVLGLLWILSDTGVMTVKVPWFPVVLVIVALGIIFGKTAKK